MGIIAELKRRNVVRMAILYVVAAWLVIQVADVLFDAMELPPQWTRLVLAILLLGFPIVLIFSWVYEMTPDGIKRESEVDRSQSITGETGRKLNVLTAVLLVLAILAVGADRLVPENTDSQLAANVQADGEVSDFSIAVIPFANRSAQEDDVYFVDGIHDDILTQLARIGSLTVTSRTSVEQFRNTSMSIPEIASTLGVRNILEGGVQRAGDRVRINMQLIDATNDDHLWAETYERELTASNIFAVQADIAKAVTEALQATLQSDEEAALDERPTNSIEAYDLYLLGRHHWNKRTEESLQLAKDYFERAIEEDPNYVLALSGLADSYSFLVNYGNLDGAIGYPQAQGAIDAAMALDESVAEVWASRGLLLWVGEELVEAEQALLRAIELDEKSYTAWLWYGNVLNALRRHSDALAAYEMAYRLEPMALPVLGNLAFHYNIRGRSEDSRPLIERLITVDPAREGSHRTGLADTYFHDGELATAVARYRDVLAVDPNNYRALLWQGHTYLVMGNLVEGQRWLVRAETVAPLSGARYPLYEIAGDYDGATAYIEDVVRRLGTRQLVQPIATLFRTRYMAGDIPGAAVYLKEYLGLLNGQLDINPSDWDQLDELLVAGFLIEHGDDHGFDSAQGRGMLDEIHSSLVSLNQQGYEHPMTLISLSAASALKGDNLAALENAAQAVERGFRGWYNVTEYPWMMALNEELARMGILALVTAEREKQLQMLEGIALAPFAEDATRQPLAMSREAFREYQGYYTDGNFLLRVFIDDEGRFSAVAGQNNPTAQMVPFEDDAFYSSISQNFVFRFGRDERESVSHVTLEISGDVIRFKRTEPPPPPIQVPREDLSRYEGTYAWSRVTAGAEAVSEADRWVAEISVDDEGVLWLDFDNQPKLYLAPYAEHKFHLSGFDTTLEFVFDEGSEVPTRVLNVSDGTLREFLRQ